jgi:NADH:ubiquinone oxidoreductase subunit 2 (subunit N)
MVACLSIFVGSFSLLSQVKIQRFFAFSSICHVGFLLLALIFGGYSAYIQYIMIYALTTINLFIIILLSPKITGIHIFNINRTGLPIFLALSLNLFSLAGLPPLAGFFTKLGLFGTILNEPYVGYGLILLFILGSIVSAFNYFRIISKQLELDLIGPTGQIIVPRITSLYDILAVLTTVLIIYPLI